MLRMKPRELDDLHQREFAAEFNFGAGQGLSIEQSAERTLHADHAVPVRPQFKPCICHSVAKAGRSAGADNSHVAREEQRREGAVEAHQLLAATLDACLLARNATQTTKQESATPANNQSGVAFNVSIAFCDAAVLTVTSIPSLFGSSHMM